MKRNNTYKNESFWRGSIDMIKKKIPDFDPDKLNQTRTLEKRKNNAIKSALILYQTCINNNLLLNNT